MAKKLIGQYLLEGEAIRLEQLERAFEIQSNYTEVGPAPLIGVILVQMGVIRSEDFLSVLARQKRDRRHRTRGIS